MQDRLASTAAPDSSHLSTLRVLHWLLLFGRQQGHAGESGGCPDLCIEVEVGEQHCHLTFDLVRDALADGC